MTERNVRPLVAVWANGAFTKEMAYAGARSGGQGPGARRPHGCVAEEEGARPAGAFVKPNVRANAAPRPCDA